MGKKKSTPKIKNVPKESNINKSKIDDINYPIFCFKYLQDTSIKNSADVDFFREFLFRLQKLAELGWREIGKSHKHSFGTENISINELKPKNYPPIMTPEVRYLTVFRANGDKRPFLGIREKDIFHVIFIEAQFGDIYNHNP
ncbi:MAG: hypothetical protein FWF53_02505 [Candidatus Azobacteroides sp.]|nr:hypothetical protein [Candidatus Azobacteroides sp.]